MLFESILLYIENKISQFRFFFENPLLSENKMSTDIKKLREIGNAERGTDIGKIRIKKKSKKNETGAPESKSSVKIHLGQSRNP